MKYWRLYLQYMNPTLANRQFEVYVTSGYTKMEAIEKITSYPWESWAQTEVLHTEYLGEYENDEKPSSWPAADASIFEKKPRQRRSKGAVDRERQMKNKAKAELARRRRLKKAEKESK